MTAIKKTDVLSPAVEKGIDSLAKQVKLLTEDLKELTVASLAQKEAMKGTNISFSKIKKSTKEVGEATEKLKQKEKELTDLQKATEKFRQGRLTDQSKEIKLLKQIGAQKEKNKKITNLELLALKSGEGSYKRINLALNQNIQKYQQLSAAQRQNKSVGGSLLKTIQQQDKELKKLDATLGRNQRNVGNYGKALGGLKGLLGAFGVAGGVMMFTRVLKDSLGRIREFDKEMQNMAGIAGLSRNGLNDVSEKIKEVAGNSIKTSNEVAKLATTLFTLGKTRKEVILMLKPVNDLAIGLNATSEDAADFLGQTLNAFGKGAESSQEFADIIANVRASSSLDFERIKESLGFVAPTANALGLSLGDISARLAVLQDNGIKAARAGRLLNTSFARLIDKGFTLDEALVEINNSTDKVKTSSDLFGKQSFTLGLILAENTDKTALLANEFDNLSKGSLKKLTDEQLKATDAKLKILDSTWEKFILTIDSGNGFISKSVNGLVSMATSFIELITPAKILSNEILTNSVNFNLLYDQLIKTNPKTKERLDLINKLQRSYPDYNASIDLNTANEQELRAELLLTNKAYQDRYLIQLQQETIDKELKTLTEEKINVARQEIELNKKIAEVALDNDLAEKISGKTLEEKIKIIEDIGRTEQWRLLTINGLYGEYLNSTEDAAEAQDDYNKVAEEATKIINSLGGEVKKTGDETVITASKTEKAVRKSIKTDKEIAKEKKKIADKEKQLIKETLDAEKNKNALLQLENKTLFANNIIDEETYNQEKSDLQADLLNDTKTALQGLLDANEVTGEQKIKVEADLAKTSLALENKLLDDKIKLRKDKEKENRELIIEQIQAESKAHHARVEGLNEALITGEMKEREYLDEMKKLDDLHLQNQVDNLNALLANTELTADQRLDVETRLAEAQKALTDSSVEATIEAERKKLEIRKAAIDTIVELADAAFAWNAGKNDEELENINIRNQEELAAAGENEAAKEEINKRFDAERAAAKTKQAKADRTLALFRIAISTAVAIAEASPIVPLMIFAGITGAAQAAIVLAKPIPKFAKGVKGFKGGAAELAEEGREMVETPKGSFLVDNPSILNLPANSNVYTNAETERMLEAKPNINNTKAEKAGDAVFQNMMLANIEKAIKKQKGVVINVDKNGLTVLRGAQNRVERRLNELVD